MGLFGGSDKGFNAALQALAQNRAMYEGLALPEYTQFNPELYETESAQYETINEDPVIKARQLEALARMEDLSNEGLSAVDKAGFAEARSLGNQIARSKTDSAIQDAQVRGVSGSGSEAALRESAAQAAAERAQQAALAQQQAQAQQRAQYLQAYANQGNAVRDQDYRTGSANTNIINQFNQANTQARNQTQHANVDTRNQAFQYNEGLKDKNYENQTGKADRIAGINNQVAETRAAQDAANKKKKQAVIGTIGAVAGGALGGPAGAIIGSQAGNLF